MRIYAFVGHYPSPYKPYYDTQFTDFLRSGHDLRIMAAPPLDDTLNDKVIRNRLLDRTRYYPESGRHVRARAVRRVATEPLKAAAFLRSGRCNGTRRSAVELLSMLDLPGEAPDIAIVHELGVGMRFHRLREWYPGVRVGLYYHGGEVASVESHSGVSVSRTFAAFDVVFTNTGFSRQQAIERGCPPDRIIVLPVGFELDDYRPSPDRSYRRDGQLNLLSVGRMSEEKGLLYALDALRRVVQAGCTAVRYSIVGEGYFRSELEKYVGENDLSDYVHFLGALSTREVIDTMAMTDALILPSVSLGTWTETQACAVQEAMLMKALVVTTRTGGVPESIPPAMHRFSVPERDSAALARAIMSLFDLSEKEMLGMGAEGRDFVADRYDITKLNRAMLARLQ